MFVHLAASFRFQFQLLTQKKGGEDEKRNSLYADFSVLNNHLIVLLRSIGFP